MKRVDPITVAVALLAAVVVVYATAPWGPAIYRLGLHNVTAAQAWIDGRAACTTYGEPFTEWPPLFAALLAAGKLCGIDYADTARFSNALAMAATVLAMGWLLRRAFESRAVAVVGAIGPVFVPTIFEQATTLSSEPLFVVFVLGALASAILDLEQPRRLSFAAAVVFAALACLQRYVGVVAIGTVALMFAFGSSGTLRWKRALLFSVLAALPLCLWLVRNYGLAGKPTGERSEPEQTLEQNLHDAGRILLDWPLAHSRNAWLKVAAGWFLALLAPLAVLWPRASDPGSWRKLALFAAFPALYVVFLITIASVMWLDPIDARLLYPAMPFAWALAVVGAAALVRRASNVGPSAKWIATAALALGFAAVLVEGARTTAAMTADARTNGPGGFGTRSSAESGLVRWLREHPPTDSVRSNFPEIVAFAIQRPAHVVPGNAAMKALGAIDPRESPFELVWFEHGNSTLPEQLESGNRKRVKAELLAEFADGKVYRITIEPRDASQKQG